MMLGGIVLVLIAAVVATETAWGRRQVGHVVEAQVNGRLAKGVHFSMGALRGGLGGPWSVDSLALVDSAGRPVISIAHASADASVSSLLGGDIRLGLVRLEGVRAFLEQRRDGNWNVSYLIRPSSGPPRPSGARGIVTVDSVALIDARMEMLSLDTTPALPLQRRVYSGINIALGATTLSSRDSVGGWAPIRALRLGIDSPPVTVVSAMGHIRWWSDSIRIDVPTLRLPASRAGVQGVVSWPSKKPVSVVLDVRADSMSIPDVRWVSTLLPHTGVASARLTVRSAPRGGFRYIISQFDLRAVNSHLAGSLTVAPGRPTEVTDLAIDFQSLDFALLRDVFGDSILKPAWRGALTGTLRGRGGRLDSLLIDAAAVAFADARAKGAHSHLVGAGALDLTGAGTRLINMDLRIDSLDVRTIGAIATVADSLHGVLMGHVQLDGPTKDLTFRNLWLQHVDGARARSTFSGAGRIASDTRTRWLDAKLVLDTIALATLIRDRATTPLQGTAHGTLDAHATGDTLTLDVTAQSGATSAHVAGTTLLDSIRVVMELNGTVSKLDPRTFVDRKDIPVMSIDGAVVLDINDTKTQVDRHIGIRFDSTSKIGESHVRAGVVRFGLDASGFHMDTADVRADGWAVDARGRLARRGEGVADSVTFAAMIDSLSVLRTLMLDSTGAPRFKDMRGRLRATNGVLQGSFENMALRADIGAERMSIGTVGLRNGTGRVDMRALPDHATGTIRGTVDSLSNGNAGVDLASVTAQFDSGERLRVTATASVGDTIRVAGVGEVTWPDEGVRIRLDSLTSSLGEHRWRLTAPAHAWITPRATELDSLVMRSDHGALAAAYGSVPETGPISASMRIVSLGFEEIGFLGYFPADLSGQLSALARITGTRDAPLIAATATLDSIRSADRARPTLAFEGNYAARKAAITLNATIGGRRVLDITGNVPLDLSLREVEDRVIEAPMALTLRADSLTLADFEALAPSVTGLGGSVHGLVDVGGTLRHPTGRGTLNLRNGAFELPAYGFVARSAEMALALAGDSVFVKRLRLSDGDSPQDSAAITGVIRLAGTNWSKWLVNLQSTASRFRVIDDPRLATAEASWELGITGALGEPRLTGAVRLPYAVFTIGPQKRARVIGRSAGTKQIVGMPNVDGVTVTLGNDVRLKSKDANVQLSGDVELFGALNRPWISGAVSATRGTYRVDLGLIKRTFRVDSGSVILEGTPDIPAALDIFTSYTVRGVDDDIHIGAHLYGTTGKPRLDLTSDQGSAVGQGEIISYLVFGQSSFALDQARANPGRTAAAALVPSLGGVLEGFLGTLLPFFSTLQVNTVANDNAQSTFANPVDNLLNSFAVTGGRQMGTDSFFSVSGGVCRGSRVSTTASSPFWLGTAVEYRPKRSIGAAITIDPGPAPCSRVGTIGDTYQIGLDLSYEWKFGGVKKKP